MLSGHIIYFTFSVVLIGMLRCPQLSAQNVSADSFIINYSSLISGGDSLFSNINSSGFVIKASSDMPKGNFSWLRSTWKKLITDILVSKISVGYDYGFVPGYDYSQSFPVRTFVSDGSISIPLSGVPFAVIYHYSSMKSTFGLGNYFRVSYDYQAYKKKIEAKKFGYAQKLSDQLDSLTVLKQTSLQKAYYWQMIESMLSNQIETYSEDSIATEVKGNYSLIKDTLIDLITADKNKVQTDSLSSGFCAEERELKIDSVSSVAVEYVKNADATNLGKGLNHLVSKKHLQDSLSRAKAYHEKFLTLFAKSLKEMEKVQVIIDQIKSGGSDPGGFIKTLGPLERLMIHAKTLDIGLNYPAHSIFLVSNVPLRGVNFEWCNETYYFAASAGLVENNLLLHDNLQQNKLFNTKNIFDLLDFRNISERKKVVSVKCGLGKKESSHFFVGLLSGVGLSSTDFSDTSFVQNSSIADKEHNLVLEVDCKLQVWKHHTVELSLGKSAFKGGEINSENSSKGIFNHLIDPENKNKAARVSYCGELEKSGTSINLSGSYVDPFFRSFGMGFIQPNHLRYELRINKRLFFSWKISAFYQREHDNIIEIFDYTNVLQRGGLSLYGMIGRNWSVKWTYQPIFQRVSINADASISKAHNNISNLSIVYNHGIGKSQLIVNALYSLYRLGDTIGIDYTLTNGTLFCSLEQKKLEHLLSLNYFNSNESDHIATDACIFEYQLSFRPFNKLNILSGVRYSLDTVTAFSWGGIVSADFQVTKFMNIKLEAERMVQSDSYSNFITAGIENFPYLLSTRFTFNLYPQ